RDGAVARALVGRDRRARTRHRARGGTHERAARDMGAMNRLAVALLLVLTAAACARRRNLGANGDERRVAEDMPQIEEATGLKFKRTPKLERRSHEQVRQFLLATFNESQPAEEVQAEETAYKLLGMIPDSMHLRDFLI